MSSVFLIAQSHDAAFLSTRSAEGARKMLPFMPESEVYRVTDGGRTALWGWSVVDEGARGSYWAFRGDEGLVYQGWVDEAADAPMEVSVAENLLDEFATRPFEAALNELDGDYSVAHVSPCGTVRAGIDFIGGSHLYFGERNGVSVISNRATVAAAFLHGGTLPESHHLPMAWLHYTFSSFLGDETLWPNIKLLRPRNVVSLRDGRCHVQAMAADRRGADLSWEEAVEGFKRRSSVVERLPDLPFQLALTGGKDSRTVLAGLSAAGHLGRIQRAYLVAEESHPDAVVGRRLAEHYGLSFELEEQGTPGGLSLRESMERHNFHAEVALNAWDRKGFEPKHRVGDLRGYYGEIYKSHALPGLGVAWSVVRAVYTAKPFLDPHGILTPQARKHCRRALLAWIEEQVQAGLLPRHAHNVIHRDGRMTRWVGQAMLWDAAGAPCVNTIPSRPLFNRYLNTPLKEQGRYRFHYELIHRCDPWLSAQPFANDRWGRGLAPGRGGRPKPHVGRASTTDYRFTEWAKEHRAIEAAILAPDSSGRFFDIFQRAGLKRLLERTRKSPNNGRLKAVLGVLGNRVFIDDGITPSPIRLPSRTQE